MDLLTVSSPLDSVAGLKAPLMILIGLANKDPHKLLALDLPVTIQGVSIKRDMYFVSLDTHFLQYEIWIQKSCNCNTKSQYFDSLSPACCFSTLICLILCRWLLHIHWGQCSCQARTQGTADQSECSTRRPGSNVSEILVLHVWTQCC